MPLLMSPVDGSPMRQVHRYGIEIDVCPTSGGIWLDKGELEKLMAFLKEESMGDASPHYRDGFRSGRAERYDHDEDEDDYDDREGRHNAGYRREEKKGKMSRMMDIFDF